MSYIVLIKLNRFFICGTRIFEIVQSAISRFRGKISQFRNAENLMRIRLKNEISVNNAVQSKTIIKFKCCLSDANAMKRVVRIV